LAYSCPFSAKLPSLAELNKLFEVAVEATVLKSTTGIGQHEFLVAVEVVDVGVVYDDDLSNWLKLRLCRNQCIDELIVR